MASKMAATITGATPATAVMLRLMAEKAIHDDIEKVTGKPRGGGVDSVGCPRSPQLGTIGTVENVET